MEVADQWRREWAGAAEYGKVTEGGVTRRVARAMEVLNASAPGARVRVMRAAYHSTSGPGLPASSFMLHSSRRVISSGYNILESPTYPTKPLEISSTPLESSPDFIETENYKVTEPDDMDISEPSKWRGTTNGSTIRMPSEESSSTDNASVIDLDSRLHYKGLNRKYSCDSENSDIQSFKRNSARTSPLLDPPVALSTLKYKSLLNGSNDWNNRRKSYSFEDTSPLNEIILQSNDTLAMESSTDSGICKSSEIVNDTDDFPKGFAAIDKKHNDHEESFEQWRLKNNPMFFRSSRIKSYREHDTVIEDPNENNITLQSKGKVSITVPIIIEGDDDNFKKPLTKEDIDRKVKKVEFCKTELHFAAESGKVNIIATDEKPPPSFDFRKRRSAFVPINNRFEKPITLFGEKSDTIDPANVATENNESVEFDENTAATKSILKNKIPKPKPYLLGENMVFGESRPKEESVRDCFSSVGVCLINKQLQTKTTFHNEEESNFSNINNRILEQSSGTVKKGPLNDQNLGNIEHQIKFTEKAITTRGSIGKKFCDLNMSPTRKSKTRQLRESELTYFGIDNYQENITNDSMKKYKSKPISGSGTSSNDTFESVRLIKQISNSAHNSEAESEDSPEYQNIPMKTNFAPVPTPRSRVKYKLPEDDVNSLGTIAEHTRVSNDMRRSRSRKQESGTVVATRSISEPAKKRNDATRHETNAIKRGDSFRRNKTCKDIEDRVINRAVDTKKPYNVRQKVKIEESPLYINIKNGDNKEISTSNIAKERNELINKMNVENQNKIRSTQNSKEKSIISDIDDNFNRNSTVKKQHPQRTEKLSTPEYSMYHKNKSPINSKTNKENKLVEDSSPTLKKEYAYNKSLQRKDGKSSEMNKQENKLAEVDSQSSNRDKRRKERDEGKNRDTTSSSDKQLYKKGISEINKNKTQYSSGSLAKTKHIDSIDKDERERGRRPSRRSEYVIKYDDQNGTVSSVCKVKAGHSTSRKKHISKDRSKEERKETKKTQKILDKPVLLELPDHHRNLYGRQEDRKRNTKLNVQRSCQLL